jgi:hypothetical protein
VCAGEELAVRVSLGLVPELHRCKFHHCRMRSRTEPAPMFAALGSRVERLKRVVWHCPRKDCHFVICGEQNYIRNTEEIKCISALGRDYA